MNKLFFVLLAICLVSVHAFVKRDAPATSAPSGTSPDVIAEIQQKFKEIGNQVAQAFDPETIKSSVDKLSEQVKDMISKIPVAKPAAPQ